MGNSQNLRLKTAINTQDVSTVKRVLELRHCAVGRSFAKGDPPIIECVRHGSYSGEIDDAKRCEILRLLLQHLADVNALSVLNEEPYGATAAMFAAMRGFETCLQFLVESGADLSVTSKPGLNFKTGYTALMLACMVNKASIVRYLTQSMSAELLDQRNNEGNTALMIVARRPNWLYSRCFQELIDAGANIHLRNEKGQAALLLAMKTDNVEAAKILLDHGADVNTISHKGETLLTHARPAFIPGLLKHGLDPTMSRRNAHCLHLAAARDRPIAVRALVKNGFPPLDLVTGCNPFFPSVPTSPLSTAIIKLRPAIAKYLITNNFFTRYDVTRLCGQQEIRQYLESVTDDRLTHAIECLHILDYLSKIQHSLFTICLIKVTSTLSQNLTIMPDKSERRQSVWTFRPSFRERVESLAIPPAIKRDLLHQAPSNSICCQLWCDIKLGKDQKVQDTDCECCAGTF